MKQTKPTILIIDDSELMRAKIRDIFEVLNLEVIGEAANGKYGYKRYLELQPDIIILDQEMPEMDGISVLKKIRAYDSKTIIIMVTSANTEEKVKEAIQSKVNNYIVKPFDNKGLAKIIFLEWKKQQRRCQC